MDRCTHLVLHNEKDITGDIKSCEFNPSTQKYEITFQNGKTYNYNYSSIELITNPKTISPSDMRIMHMNRELFKFMPYMYLVQRMQTTGILVFQMAAGERTILTT